MISDFLGIKEFNQEVKISKENQGLGEASNVSLEIRDKIRDKLSATYDWIREETGISWDQIK